MNKSLLYNFSLELRKILQTGNTKEVENRIANANLSQEETDFIFKCLHSNGYDPKTDRFLLYETDNSAFLKLVNIVQSNSTKKR